LIDTTYSEIKSEPADVSSCNQSNIPFRIAKKEARPAVPTLQWTRSKESPLLTVIKQEFPTEFRNVPPKQSMLCLNSIIDNEKRLVVKGRLLVDGSDILNEIINFLFSILSSQITHFTWHCNQSEGFRVGYVRQ